MKKTLQAMLIALVAIMMPIGAWAQETITYSLTIPSTGHTTLYLDFNAVIPEYINAYIVTEVSMSGGIKFKEIGGVDRVIPANTGVVIEGEAGTYEFIPTSSADVNPVNNNLLKGSLYEITLEESDSVYYYILAEKSMFMYNIREDEKKKKKMKTCQVDKIYRYSIHPGVEPGKRTPFVKFA